MFSPAVGARARIALCHVRFVVLLAGASLAAGCSTDAPITNPSCTDNCTDPPATPPPPAPPTPPPAPSSSRWVTGYYVGYQRSMYPEDQIDFTSITHITVARIRPNADGTLVTDFDIDNVTGPQMARTISTRAHQAGRKAILMLGGDGEHAGFVGAASAAYRATFVHNLLQAVTDYGYDGLDVDWEPMDPADEAPLLQLLTDLRNARPSMLITLPVGFTNANSPSVGPWYAQAAPLVDQMNMMTYEMSGNWGGWQSWHSSALDDAQPSHPTSIASSAHSYLQGGVPAAKLGIGIPFYGACWRGPTAPRQALGAGQDVVASDNVMTYAHILSAYLAVGTRQWDAAAQVPYLGFTTATGPERCNFVSYEDEQSVAAKGAWVKANGLGGAIIWTINEGHVATAAAGKRDPLLTATYTAIVP